MIANSAAASAASSAVVLGFDRGLMGLSLAVHIILASLGMALPLIMVLAEIISIRKKDKDYEVLAKRISKIFLLFLGLGTASGILISVIMLVLWPNFMTLVSQVAILPFNFETVSFLLESLFVGIYFFSWGKMKGKYSHVLLGIPIVIGGMFSAVFITVANAWMNTPVGFSIKTYLTNGTLTNVNPMAVFSSPSAATEISHVVSTTYFMGVFIILAYFAIMLLRKSGEKEKKYYKKGIWLLIILATVFVLWSLESGHDSGTKLMIQQPEKYAALEADINQTAYAPEIIGGIPADNGTKVSGSLADIPDLQSLLATGKESGTVPGLNEFNSSTWPPLYVHLEFDTMVIGGFAVAFMLALVIFLRLIKRDPVSDKTWWSRTILVLLAICGLVAILLVEAGWDMAETARQPWIIYDVMTVSQAANYSPSVLPLAIAITAFYIIVLPLSVVILRFMFRKNPLSKELRGTGK